MDNGSSFADFGVIPTPGIDAALTGMWRGRNKADNEAANKPVPNTDQAEKNRERYRRE